MRTLKRQIATVYRLITTSEEHGIVLRTSQLQKKLAMTELKKYADENEWTLILSEGGKGDCTIQELTTC